MDNFEVIGLLLNFVGTFILAIPNLDYKREWDKERDANIYWDEDGKHKYTTERIKSNSTINGWAILIIIIGFGLTLWGLSKK